MCDFDVDPCDSRDVCCVTDSIIIEDLQRCKAAWGRAEQVEIKYTAERYVLLTGLFTYSNLDGEPSLIQ